MKDESLALGDAENELVSSNFAGPVQKSAPGN